VKVDFLNKYRLNRVIPPSWIIFCQTQWLFVDASTTHKTHNVAKISFFFQFLSGILDFTAILDSRGRILKA
jgi:hypothetical protein